MAIGFFSGQGNSAVPADVQAATPSIFRLDTGRMLHHRVFDTNEAADQWDGFEVDDAGVETVQCGWTQAQIDDLNLEIPGPDWARGFLHELVVHLAQGGTLPYQTALTGFGTATLVSQSGHLLTNQHLVTGPQKHHGMPECTFDREGLPAPNLRVLTGTGDDLGPVRLCYVDSALDLAVLKIDPPADIAPIAIPESAPRLHERVWQWAYPHRSFRSESERNFLGFEEANHELRYSPGLVIAEAGQREWFTDGDVVLGSSGSALLNDTGQIVGVYRGGGAKDLYPDDPYKYRRCVDVHRLKQDLSHVLGPVEASASQARPQARE